MVHVPCDGLQVGRRLCELQVRYSSRFASGCFSSKDLCTRMVLDGVVLAVQEKFVDIYLAHDIEDRSKYN